jgi:hypothetical protein
MHGQGEIAVLGLAKFRTATLQANTVCLAQMLHRPIFMKYLSEFPREMIQFQEVGTARLEKTPVSGDANLFKKQPLFSACEPAFQEELYKHVRRKFFFAGQKIVKEGSDCNEMYAIQQGHAVVEPVDNASARLTLGSVSGRWQLWVSPSPRL